jgi:type 1 glutamine amidotransferase
MERVRRSGSIMVSIVAIMLAIGCDHQRTSEPSILIFSKTAGFRHTSIPVAIESIREFTSGLVRVDATESSEAFTTDNLARYKAVVFLSTTGDVLNAEQERAFESYIEGGGGFVGIHAASDTEYTWPWYAEMIGAHFAGHPPTQAAVVIVEDHSHPSTATLPDRWPRTDEWYRFNRNPRTVEGIHVLGALDESTYEGGGMNGDHPCIWWRMMGQGRCWYTAGGHTEESFAEPLFREHLREGIRWAAKLE